MNTDRFFCVRAGMRINMATSNGTMGWGWTTLIVPAGFLLAGCATPDESLDYEPRIARFFMEAPAEAPMAYTVELPRSGVRIPVFPTAVLSEVDVANVELIKVDLGLCLMFEFTPQGARNLLRVTSANLGRRLVVEINGAPLGARLIDGPVNDGRLFAFLELSDEQLTDESVNLKRTAADIQEAARRASGSES